MPEAKSTVASFSMLDLGCHSREEKLYVARALRPNSPELQHSDLVREPSKGHCR